MSLKFSAMLHFAGRELKGGMRRFRVFLICIALGVAAITAVLSTSGALQSSLGREGQNLLGGDAEFTLIHRRATKQELSLLRSGARVSEVASLRAMARAGKGAALPALIELKAVDTLYPLTGRLTTSPTGLLAQLKNGTGEKRGALVEETLLGRLNIKPGETITIGKANFRVLGVLNREPDRLGSGFPMGPRVLINKAGLDDTGLIVPGSLIRWHYRVLLPAGADLARIRAFVARIKAGASEAGWRIRDRANAAPRLRRFVSRVTIFFTFIALASLITGGVGVAASVKSYL
ncbi:MAG TPA: ABC transporter permease, partial [Rhizobiales bacterium]|nr:ABC transporter permease [Hyphomicrobiales bacterium]